MMLYHGSNVEIEEIDLTNVNHIKILGADFILPQ